MAEQLGTKNIFGGNGGIITDLTITNNLGVGNTITAGTVNATNGNFTNLTGTVTPGQLLVNRNETSRDNASIISGNSTATLANNSNGVHMGYDNTNQIGSIYCMNNSNVITDLYLNNTSTLGQGTVHVGGLKTDSINEETALNGIQVNSGMKLFDYGLYNSASNLRLNSNTSYVDLQSAGVSVLKADSSLITASQPVTASQGITIPAGKNLTLGVGGSLLNSTNMQLYSGLYDAVHVSTVGSASNQWIGISSGIDGTGVNRVVMGNLSGSAMIGGHVFTSGVGYTAWADLSINDNASANVHINPTTYTSANRLSCAGSVDVQTSYKINNACTIDYAGGSTANTFSFPNKGSSSYTIATTADIPAVTYKQTIYFTSNGNLVNNWFMGPSGMNSVETNFSWIVNRTGTMSNMRVKLGAGPGAGVTFTFTVRADAVDTALTVSIIDANTTGSNLGTTVAISAGQLYSMSFVTTGAAPTTYALVSFDFTQ